MTHPKSATLLHAHQFAGYGGVPIAADVGGPESGLPIVLLHGNGQTRHSWKNLAQTLVRNGYRVTNFDHRGHGDSGWAADGNYEIDAFVGDLKNVIAQQPSPPVLVGASLGGITSLLAAGESEAPIARGLALVDIVPKIEAAGSQAILKFMSANPDGFASLDEAAAAVTAYLPHRPRPSSNDGLMKNLRKRDNGRLYWHWDPKMLADTKSRQEKAEQRTVRMEAAARRIRIPTLLVRGGKSDLVSVEGVKRFLTLIPDADFVDVKDATHMVTGDMNDVFSRAVIDFIEQRVHA